MFWVAHVLVTLVGCAIVDALRDAVVDPLVTAVQSLHTHQAGHFECSICVGDAPCIDQSYVVKLVYVRLSQSSVQICVLLQVLVRRHRNWKL